MGKNKTGSGQIAVFGLGSAGSRIANRVGAQQSVVDFFAIDTDIELLLSMKIQSIHLAYTPDSDETFLGRTEGTKKSILDNKEMFTEIISQYDVIYLVVGMGGATGTGVSMTLPKLIKEQGKQCIAIVSTPFAFEGKLRRCSSGQGLEEMHNIVDICHVVECQRLLRVPVFADYPFRTAFQIIDRLIELVLNGSLQSQEAYRWDKIKENDTYTIVGVGIADEKTSLREAVHQAVEIQNNDENIISQSVHVILCLSASMDHKEVCIDSAKRVLPPNANVNYHFEVQESMKYESLIVITSATNPPLEKKTEPIELTFPSRKIGACGSQNHGIGGSFSTDSIRPRLWNTLSKNEKQTHKQPNDFPDDG